MVYVKTRRYNKRGKSGYEVDITIHFPDNLPPHRVRKKAPTNTEKQAYQWGLTLGMEISKRGRPGREEPPKKAAPDIITFEELVPIYIERWVQEEALTRSTLLKRQYQIEHYFIPRVGHLRLDQIDEDQLVAVRQSLRVKENGDLRSPNHKNGLMAFLGHMLRKAHKWKLLPTLPVMPEPAKGKPEEIEVYKPDELERLQAAAKQHSEAAYLVVLLGSEAGLRVGEMLGLPWSNVDLKLKALVVSQQEVRRDEITPPKGKKSRTIEMGPLLYAALKAAHHLGEFVLMPRGEKLTRHQLAALVVAAEKRAGIIKCRSPHKLRHTFATVLLAKGANVKAVQALMGHASLQTTLKYLHLLPNETAKAMSLLWSGDKPETKEEKEKR